MGVIRDRANRRGEGGRLLAFMDHHLVIRLCASVIVSAVCCVLCAVWQCGSVCCVLCCAVVATTSLFVVRLLQALVAMLRYGAFEIVTIMMMIVMMMMMMMMRLELHLGTGTVGT